MTDHQLEQINMEIRDAIDHFDLEQARNLLRDALKQNPTADTFYLASMMVETNWQRREYLEKAINLDPFHKEALAEYENIKTRNSRKTEEQAGRNIVWWNFGRNWKAFQFLGIGVILVAIGAILLRNNENRSSVDGNQGGFFDPNFQIETQTFTVAGIDFEYHYDSSENYYPILTLSGQEVDTLVRQFNNEIQMYGITEKIKIDPQRLKNNEGLNDAFLTGTLSEIDGYLQDYVSDSGKPVSVLLLIPNSELSSNDRYVAGTTEIPNLFILYHVGLIDTLASNGKVALLSSVKDVDAMIVGAVGDHLTTDFLKEIGKTIIEMRVELKKQVNHCLIGKWEFVENISGKYQPTGITIEFPEKDRGNYSQYDGNGVPVSTGEYRWQTKGTALGIYLYLKPEGEQKEQRFDLQCDETQKILTLTRTNIGNGRAIYWLKMVTDSIMADNQDAIPANTNQNEDSTKLPSGYEFFTREYSDGEKGECNTFVEVLEVKDNMARLHEVVECTGYVNGADRIIAVDLKDFTRSGNSFDYMDTTCGEVYIPNSGYKMIDCIHSTESVVDDEGWLWVCKAEETYFSDFGLRARGKQTCKIYEPNGDFWGTLQDKYEMTEINFPP